MSEVGVCEAESHLSALLKRVAAGESITITRHGVPVAVLCPPPARTTMTVQEAIDGIRAFRKGRRASQAEIRSWIDEGRPDEVRP